MARRTFSSNDLPDFSRPQAADYSRPHQEGEQQRGDRRSRSAKADVIEEIEDDIRSAEGCEPVIEHRSSVGMERSTGGGGMLRPGFERRNYTLQRHATGCLENHELVAANVLSQQRSQH